MDPVTFIAPAEISVPLDGGAIVVRPMSIGQIGQVMATAAPVVHALLALPEDTIARFTQADAGGPTLDDIVLLFELLADQPQRLVQLVAIAARLEPAAVEAMLPDRFAFLFAVVVQANADFFSRAAPVFAAAGRLLETIKTPSGRAASTP